MGRPPCCDKVSIKKGPWTPEEDIILVSYIQEHGPGNWRSVPTNTGLSRCSKSCRLRWTNYLRPGIKRGNFTPHEEGMIVHLQALLGNKWAAIASYLPQRTDNDIKNYWNTHLKKKLKKLESALEINQDSSTNNFVAPLPDRTFDGVSSTTYASSTENISRLLQGWMKSSPKPKTEVESSGGDHHMMISNDDFESIMSFDNIHSVWEEKTSCQDSSSLERKPRAEDRRNQNVNPPPPPTTPPLSFLEKWLLDENTTEIMELSSPIY